MYTCDGCEQEHAGEPLDFAGSRLCPVCVAGVAIDGEAELIELMALESEPECQRLAMLSDAMQGDLRMTRVWELEVCCG